MRHTSRSSGLLHLKASRVRISQFTSKLAEERQCVEYAASSQRSYEDKVKDRWVDVTDCIRSFYSYFTVFTVLGYRGILVFWMSL
jgi:hypothetical protein